MRALLFLCLFFSALLQAQTIADCRKRFDKYLNFRGALNGTVKFEKDALHLLSGGKASITIYEDELAALAKFLENSSVKEQEIFFNKKGTSRLSIAARDSLFEKIIDNRSIIKQADTLPLRGYKIALDPGHFGINMQDAAVEQKFLNFPLRNTNNSMDTIRLFESSLTFNTAQILKEILSRQGAEVFVTRSQAGYTSFNCTYQEFLKKYRRSTLDSLLKAGALNTARHQKLVSCNDYTFFWDFFRDYDITNRANKINAFAPHVSLIIHYNVDEKNAPWKQLTGKNFSMAFIGGAFAAGNIDRSENKMHFLRLLCTSQLDNSEKLAGKTVANFHRLLQIPIAKANDADYLRDNCLPTSQPGVFCRNLMLCRKVNSTLVYGESLYQDNEKECRELMNCSYDAYGVLTSERLVKVATAYYEAVFDYLKN